MTSKEEQIVNIKNTPKVSVIIPFYNRLEWLSEAVQTVLEQTYSNFEIILIDDGSTEDLGSLPFLQDKRVIYSRQENKGPAAARNTGIEIADGKFIAFLDSDDLFMPTKIEKQLNYMLCDKEALMSHTSYERFSNSEQVELISSGEFSGNVFPEILLECPIATPTVMVRSKVFKEFGLRFDETMKFGEDVFLWSKISKQSNILGINEPLSKVRIHSKNTAFDINVQIQHRLNTINYILSMHSDLGKVESAFLCGLQYIYMHDLYNQKRDKIAASAALIKAWENIDVESLDEIPSRGQKSSEDYKKDFFKAYKYRLSLKKQRIINFKDKSLEEEIKSLSVKPLFSILVPTYNQAQYLPEALDSLIRQSYENWEAIVVNDGSTDNTAEVMQQYAQKDPRIKTYHKANGGVSSALNEASKHARGEWLCWLSSDDLFLPDKLAVHVLSINSYPDKLFFHTNFFILDEQRLDIYTPPGYPDNSVPPQELQILSFFGPSNYINGISICIHRSVFDRIGFFNEKLRNGQDFDMWLRISAIYRSQFLSQKTCITRIQPDAGTTISYDAGIFDSGRTCLKFLNTYPFEALFPLLDLRRHDHISYAFNNTLSIVLNPASFINIGGYTQAFVDRMHEWLARSCPQELKIIYENAIEQILSASGIYNLSEEVISALQSLKGATTSGFRYKPYNPLKEMALHAERLERTGYHDKAKTIQDYLERIKKFEKEEEKVSEHKPLISVEEQSSPFFSVLVPTYNQAKYLPSALDSLLAQTYPNWEALVVNDGSTDDTSKVMEQYAAKDRRIRLFHKENGGVASALNEGLRNAKGEWICWLSSDDLFVQTKLDIHVNAFNLYPDIKVFHTDHFLLNEADQRIFPSGLNVDAIIPEFRLQTLRFLQINYFNGISICIHRSVFGRVGFFNEKIRNGQDFDMWLRISALYRSQFLPQRTSTTRIHPSSGTGLSVEVGIFDSARSCLEFLNKYTFEKLFPSINKKDKDIYLYAIAQAINIVTNPSSYINRCGYTQALIDRIREWVSHSCPKKLRNSLEEEFEQIDSAVQNSSLPEEIKAAISSLKGSTRTKFNYMPYDPLAEMNRYAERLEKACRYLEAGLIRKYLERIKQFEPEISIDTSRDRKAETPGVYERHQEHLHRETDKTVDMRKKKTKEDALNLLLAVHNVPANNRSGTELYTFNLAQQLQQREHSVSIVYPSFDKIHPPGPHTDENDNGLSVTRLTLAPPADIVHLFRNEHAASVFGSYLKGLGADLVHFHHLIGFTATSLEICKHLGIPTVLTLHDEWILCEQIHYLRADGTFCFKGPESIEKCVNCFLARNPQVPSSRENVSRLMNIFSLRRQYLHNALSWIDSLIVPSKFLQQALETHGFMHPKFYLSPLGLNPFDPMPREPMNNGLRFTYLGNINFTKGLDILIQAFNMLSGNKAQLNIYGTVQDQAYFQRTMTLNNKGENVTYHGPYKPDSLPAILAKTDIAVVPSRSEHYPFVVRECLHAGVPVIASDVGGVPEIIEDGVNGFLFRPGDYQDLAMRLQFFVLNPKKVSAFRKHIKPVRSIAEDADQLEIIYREALTRKARS